jgi:hypothetical protein
MTLATPRRQPEESRAAAVGEPGELGGTRRRCAVVDEQELTDLGRDALEEVRLRRLGVAGNEGGDALWTQPARAKARSRRTARIRQAAFLATQAAPSPMITPRAAPANTSSQKWTPR